MKTKNSNCVGLTLLIVGVLLMSIPIPLSVAPVQSNEAKASVLIGQPALIDSPDEAFDALVGDLGHGMVDGLGIFVSRETLPEGTVITNWKGPFHTLKQSQWFIFIDDHLGANWEHPCRYAFVDPETGEFQYIEATSPPNMQGDMIRFQGPDPFGGENIVGGLLSQVNRQSSSPGHLWAVILSGGYNKANNHVRYWNDCSEIYKTLVSVYGYSDSQIIVAISDGLNPAVDQSNGQNSDPDLDGDGDDDIMYPCLYADVDFIFTNLSATLTSMDTLFIFTTDHGSGVFDVPGQPVHMNLWNAEELWDYQLADMLEPINCREMIITMEPCFSGGFVNDIIGMSSTVPRFISTAANDMEYSWAMAPDYVYDTYVFHWTAAVRWMDAYGVPVDADTNSDTEITMDEAYNYALSLDFDDEHPQYGEWPVGFGSTITLAGSGPISEGEVKLDRTGYTCNDMVNIVVEDLDLDGAGTVQVSIESNTETTPETVTLTETDTAHFEGSIALVTGTPSSDGVLQVDVVDLITVTYNDADDGTGSPAWPTDTAVVDGTPPGPPTGLTVEWWGEVIVSLIDEDFAADPTDWTITHVDGTAWTWADQRMENTWGYPSSGYLDSPVVDCSGLTGIRLSFWHYWEANYFSGTQDGYVRGSTDGGLSWPYLVDEFHHNDPATEIAVKNYLIPWADGQSQVRIRYDIYNFDDWYWHIDDVLMTAVAGSTTEHNWLNWTLSAHDGAGANDVDHYNIYRALAASGPWDATALIDTVPAGTATYMDYGRGELDGINWWYIVRAVDAVGNEDNNLNAVPELYIPSVLTSIVITPSLVSLDVSAFITVSAQGYDQFGASIACTPIWNDAMGGGSFSNIVEGNPATATYTAGPIAGSWINTIQATEGAVSGYADLVITSAGDPAMQITKTGPFIANIGQNITYIIRIWNNGTDAAYDAVLTETYPTEAMFINASVPPAIGTSIWILPIVPAGGSYVLFINVTVSESAIGKITNFVSMDYRNSAAIPMPRETASAVTNIKFKLLLVQGWNLFSLPLVPADPSLKSIFSDALTGGTSQTQSDKVFKWDTANSDWDVAYLYEDGNPANASWIFASGVFAIEPDIGYWLWIRDDLGHPGVAIDIVGDDPGQRNVPLSVGWNLVGYTSFTARPLECLAIDSSGLFANGFTGGTSQATSDRVFSWDGSGWQVQYMWENGDALDGTWMGTTFDLVPGKGYWIEVREAHSDFVWAYGA